MALLSGCMTDDKTSETNSYTVSDAVSALKVRSRGGLIDVVASDRATVEVTEKLRYSGSKPETEHAVSGSTLSLDMKDCSSCEVSYRIKVPRTLAVTLLSEGGDVRVNAVSGKLAVTTNGGSASAQALTSASARIRTDGGDADAVLSTLSTC